MAQQQQVSFDNGRGQTLVGRLDVPVGPVRAWVVFAHCFTCSRNLKVVRRIGDALTGHGFGVLSFDLTGLGDSEGDFGRSGFSSNVQDLVAAAEWLGAHHRPPRLLVGHSLGGAAVLAATAELDSVRAVATIGAPADPAHVTHLFEEAVDTIEQAGLAQVSIGGRPFRPRVRSSRTCGERRWSRRWGGWTRRC